MLSCNPRESIEGYKVTIYATNNRKFAERNKKAIMATILTPEYSNFISSPLSCQYRQARPLVPPSIVCRLR